MKSGRGRPLAMAVRWRVEDGEEVALVVGGGG